MLGLLAHTPLPPSLLPDPSFCLTIFTPFRFPTKIIMVCAQLIPIGWVSYSRVFYTNDGLRPSSFLYEDIKPPFIL